MSLADLLTQAVGDDPWYPVDYDEIRTKNPDEVRLIALAPDLAKLAIDNDRTFDWLEMALGSWAEFSGSRYSNEMLDVLAAIAAARARFAALDQRATT